MIFVVSLQILFILLFLCLVKANVLLYLLLISFNFLLFLQYDSAYLEKNGTPQLLFTSDMSLMSLRLYAVFLGEPSSLSLVRDFTLLVLHTLSVSVTLSFPTSGEFPECNEKTFIHFYF